MSSHSPESDVLIVTDTVIAASSLARVGRDRAKAGRHHFTLLIPAVAHGPHRVVDPEDPMPCSGRANNSRFATIARRCCGRPAVTTTPRFPTPSNAAATDLLAADRTRLRSGAAPRVEP